MFRPKISRKRRVVEYEKPLDDMRYFDRNSYDTVYIACTNDDRSKGTFQACPLAVLL